MVPDLKEIAVGFMIGAVFFATQGLLWFYKRHQLLRGVLEENVLRQKRRTFQRDGIIRLVIALLLFTLLCCIEIFSSAGGVIILAMISLTIFGVSLMSGFFILAEKSKWRS